ncbi:MAG TPA: hypothetical protein VNN79_08810 [Actinomycetota bacterium]|nr:hypothetical protein [Actinomycetota bacterium]
MNVDVPDFGQQYRNGSHRGPNPPAHCQRCGRPMRVYETQGAIEAAESRFKPDGSPNLVRHAKCSAPLLLRLLDIFGFHDHALQDQHGDWPWI